MAIHREMGMPDGAERVASSWPGPCDGGYMTQQMTPTHKRDTVVLFGGKGGLEARYRDAVEQSGYEFRYYEARGPAHGGPLASRVALVIVIASMVSHPLMTQARQLAGDATRIVYLRSASISALRQTMAVRNSALNSTPRAA
jgi:hypothetical protein